MFHVKAKISDSAEINIEITDENVFTTCPRCGVEHAVDIQDLFSDGDTDLYSTVVYCSKCSQAFSGTPDIVKEEEL